MLEGYSKDRSKVSSKSASRRCFFPGARSAPTNCGSRSRIRRRAYGNFSRCYQNRPMITIRRRHHRSSLRKWHLRVPHSRKYREQGSPFSVQRRRTSPLGCIWGLHVFKIWRPTNSAAPERLPLSSGRKHSLKSPHSLQLGALQREKPSASQILR